MNIPLTDFEYELPDERIAKYPLENRADSKLLVFNQNGNQEIQDRLFKDIDKVIPKGALLIRNNTKVIPVRMIFNKATGGWIEVFCLEPLVPHTTIELALISGSGQIWKCMGRRTAKWSLGQTIYLKVGEITLEATLLSKEERYCTVQFDYDGDYSFSTILDLVGKLPIPPYLNRQTEDIDSERYQTVFATQQGAVAAPTASLHFDAETFDKLSRNQVNIADITLHVGAGTFAPIEVDNVFDHDMHFEQISFNRSEIQKIKDSEFNIALGTTSLRAMETLFWYGVRLNIGKSTEFKIDKSFVFRHKSTKVDFDKAIQAILDYMDTNEISILHGSTGIMITPDYTIRSCKALITNFHQPKSTLLMLISAVTHQNWKPIYDHALAQNYRFLSYGDSSILFV